MSRMIEILGCEKNWEKVDAYAKTLAFRNAGSHYAFSQDDLYQDMLLSVFNNKERLQEIVVEARPSYCFLIMKSCVENLRKKFACKKRFGIHVEIDKVSLDSGKPCPRSNNSFSDICATIGERIEDDLSRLFFRFVVNFQSEKVSRRILIREFRRENGEFSTSDLRESFSQFKKIYESVAV